MQSQSTTVADNQLSEALACKQLLEQALNQLEFLANQHGLAFQCITEIRMIINTATNLSLFTIVDNNLININEIGLYQFLNHIYSYKINEMIVDQFTQKEDQALAYHICKLIRDQLNQLNNYFALFNTKLFAIKKISEFDFFQKIESARIQNIKKNIDINNASFLFSENKDNFLSDSIVNADMLEEYNKKRFILLCAALLNEGVDYAKIFKFGIEFGLGRIPVSVIHDAQTPESIQKSEVQRAAIIETIKMYLLSLPLITYGISSYEDVPKTIPALQLNPQYNKILNRIELYENLGEYAYTAYKYREIRKKYGQIDRPIGNKTDEINWLTAWRDRELKNLIEQAAPYPYLVEQFNTLKDKPIEIKFFAGMVVVKGIGNIGDFILTLNAHEFMNMKLTKLNFLDFNLFSSSNDKNTVEVNHVRTATQGLH